MEMEAPLDGLLPAMKNTSLIAHIMLKKILYSYMPGKKISNSSGLGKKILTQTKSPIPLPQRSKMVNHIGGGGRCGFDTLVIVIRQKNGWRAFIMWSFSRLKFSDWIYADKRHKWEEKVQNNPQFPFCGKTRAFRYEIVFPGIGHLH